jgi:hypothetical protein
MQKLTTETIITQFTEIHGNLYDYSLVEYNGNLHKVDIICPIHGVFQQTPKEHKKGSGCNECGVIKMANKRVEKAKKIFFDEANLKHKNKYDYSMVVYKKAKLLVDIICPIHGIFPQTPNNHKRGIGCPKCGDLSTAQKLTQKEEDFIFKAIAKHGNKYDYSQIKFKNNHTEIDIKCNKCKQIFSQLPGNHIHKSTNSGCSYCNQGNRGRSTYKNRRTILYYAIIEGVYKIGVTTKTFHKRYITDLNNGNKIQLIKEWIFEDGVDAFDLEQQIIRDNKHYKYEGKKLLIGGNTELFSKNILSDINPLIESRY